MNKSIKTIIVGLLVPVIGFGQSASTADLDQNYLNWFNQDLEQDDKMGTSVDKTYKMLIKKKKAKPVSKFLKKPHRHCKSSLLIIELTDPNTAYK